MDAAAYTVSEDNRDRIVFPWIQEQITAKNPARILDFGCGNARFAVTLADTLSSEIHAYDRDPAMQQLAKNQITQGSRAAQRITLWTAPSPDWHRSFDAIFLQGVWMCWTTREECLQTLGLLRESLSPSGILIASITHPCFRDRTFATYRTDFSMNSYLENGTPFQVLVGAAGAETPILDTHWNLEDTLNQASEAGLTLLQAKEHRDQPDSGIPSWLSLVFTGR